MTLLNQRRRCVAAAKAGMDEKTARRYRDLGHFPARCLGTDLADPGRPLRRGLARTRGVAGAQPGPGGQDPLRDLQRRYPGRFPDGQLRTLQRRVKMWRALKAPRRRSSSAEVRSRRCASRTSPTAPAWESPLRVSLRSPGLPLRADLLELGDRDGLFRRELREPERGLAERPVGTGRRPAAHRTDCLSAAVHQGSIGTSSPSATRRCCGTTAWRAGDQADKPTRTATSSRAITASNGRWTRP